MTEKEEQLYEVKCCLKQHFVGLDTVIDSLIEKVRIWWCNPDYLMRPTVISLYGTTGTGKTDLINTFVKLLGMEDSFVNYEIGCDDRYIGSTIQDELRYYNITQMEPGILLIDEVQKMATYQRYDGDLQTINNKTTDLWRLLSSGRLINISENIKNLTSQIDSIQRSLMRLDRKDGEENFYRYNNVGARGKSFHLQSCIQFISKVDIPFIINIKYLYDKPEEFQKDMEMLSKYQNSPLYFRTLVNTISDRVMLEILTIKYNEYLRNKNNIKDDDFIFKKLLIFIAGNLDNLFIPKDKKEYELTCEDLEKHIKTIDNRAIKNELLTMFRPEQVSRFGNNYIVFPPLNEDDYCKIIKKLLEQYTLKVKDQYGIDISQYKRLSASFIFLKIKERGFYPSQGIRPVLTEFDCIMSEILPTIIENNQQHFVEQNRVQLF